MTTGAISLREVSKSYDRRIPAVNKVSLEIEPGEFLVLLGPSGCGKSTLLRLIAGLESATSGQVWLDGEEAGELPPAARNIAMVFQSSALYPAMSGAGNIGFPLRLGGMADEESTPRVDWAARLLGVTELLERRPGQMSGGERQRVAIGRAVVRAPSAFLLDEPLSSLDAKLRNQLRVEIARLTRELNTTTVYVTHDQGEAMSLGDRVAVMRDGVLQQVDTPRELYRMPVNVFVAAFVGVPRINLLNGTVLSPLDGPVFVDLGRQRIELPQPLPPDHQLLRIQQHRPLLIGVRAEDVRIAGPERAGPAEVPLRGVVEQVEYQGHETLLHLSIGAVPAVVPALEAPRYLPRERKSGRPSWLRLGSAPQPPAPPPAPAPQQQVGDLVVRAEAGMNPLVGDRLPVLLNTRRLFVFDEQGRRLCPAPPGGAQFYG
ncbi:sn-glycerol-3-phosphate import ATP-binding protein UgpC [Streptomyces sp. RB5]|uniref:sn-glycerol-3-phosphate import ATP-binding protein UgpC n=1 Tax=Streptomyces smaragdinus TaxID=2585196 RepID=A0A7K0CKB1_9ACTN|nr:ABC transporter ATP-binding protein [Streptomyces smaragdinus]MQY13906.1 sn-glycerol-3-phosphate import ATP-binding protein UgpC [Streptomyces smaragdinus]